MSNVDLLEFREGLRWLEEHGVLLIIPADRTRDKQTRVHLLVDLEGDGRPLIDVQDPHWIRNQERRLGIAGGWLRRRIKSLTERVWIEPEKEGAS
jgi:hypothetical protein